MLRPVALASVSACLVLATVAPPASASSAMSRSVAMVRQVNAARHAYGLAPLGASRSLTRSSRRYARRMVRGNFFAHLSHLPISRRYKRRGEVLRWATRDRPSDVIAAWLRSPVHRSILLSPSFREAGFGRARGTIRAGGRRGSAWVGHFGRR